MSELDQPVDNRGQMPFRDHLVELRQRALRAVVGVLVAFFFAWHFHLELYDWVSSPVRSAMADNGLFAIRAMQITESISVYIKIALLGGFILASPWVFFQVWAFIAPGLLRREQRLVAPVVAASVMFFLVGVAFCYVVVLPFMTDFLIKMTVEGPDVSLVPTLQNVVSYSLWLLLAFGLVFELPVFMYFLAAMQLVTAAGLVSFYRYWIVISFIIGAMLTPTPDPVNQALMSGPLVLLYGVGTAIAWVVERDRDTGSRWSWRGASALALLLTATVLLGSARIASMGAERLVDDVPLDARQVVGVRAGSVARLVQQTGTSSSYALGVIALGFNLGGYPKAKSVVWLARYESGAAAIIRRPGADRLIRTLAQQRMATMTDYAGGKSILLKLEGSDARWRVAAPDSRTLWVGEDKAVGKFAAARAGRVGTLGGDAKLLETVVQLRSQGPIFAFSVTTNGIAGWVPSGALADTVQLATAVVPVQANKILWRLECKGPEAASSLHNRLDAWVADTRASQQAPRVATRREAALADQVAKLAVLVNKATTAVIRTSHADDKTLNMLRQVASEAMEIEANARGKARSAPTEIRGDAGGPLRKAVLNEAVFSATRDGPNLRWRFEVASQRALDALFAPSAAGIQFALPPRAPKSSKAAKPNKDKARK